MATLYVNVLNKYCWMQIPVILDDLLWRSVKQVPNDQYLRPKNIGIVLHEKKQDFAMRYP